jgi:hypothetical protein
MNIKVRLIHDTKNDRWWYEELIGARWVKIPDTDMACQGNATCSLESYIQRKREEHYKLYHEVVKELTFSLGF